MKKLILASLSALLLLGACTQKSDSSTIDNPLNLADHLKGDNTVVAKVGGQNVYKSEFANYAKTRSQQELDELNVQAQQQLLDEYLQLQTLSMKAVSAGLVDNVDYGLQTHNLSKNLLAQALLKDYEQENPITDSDIAAEYEKAKSELEVPEIKGSHILLKTKEEADAVIAQLKNNPQQDFAELAKEKSTGPSGPNGGDLGWFTANRMVKPFADAIAAMQVGTVSETPVETQFGFHVIKKTDERMGTAPELENIRPRLEQQIKQDRLETYLSKIEDQLGVEILYDFAAPPLSPVIPPVSEPADTDADPEEK